MAIDELDPKLHDIGFAKPEQVTFLAEPERRARRYTVISVDDHIVEPPTMFDGRVPAAFAEAAPRVVEQDGQELWRYDGELLPNVGMNAVSGRPYTEYSMEPHRFDEMRRGSWDIDARVRDMDINGDYASVNFPSFLAGFSGQRFQLGHDPALALAVVRAWNDFIIEEWAGRYPDRIIPLQLPWLLDPELAAAEIRANAARGFKAVTFSESPERLGLPSIYSDHWDPFLRACEETETVVCLHFGSSGTSPTVSPESPPETLIVLFGINIAGALDWLCSGIPQRFPNIKLCLSEGGIGWVPPFLDRIEHIAQSYGPAMYRTFQGELTPTELFHRNFWFCAINEPSAMPVRERIGIDRITLETDYPHGDSTWPDTQAVVHRMMDGLPADDVERMTWRNAAELFRHPVPAAVRADPEAF